MIVKECIHPQFLTTRETFPGERQFAELSQDFFGVTSAEERARFISGAWEGQGLLVHMANPEQIDDLFSHIDREKKVRFLSTSYIHDDIRPTVYAIGRGTGLLLDWHSVNVDHVSYKDAVTVTDPDGQLVVADDAKVSGLTELHRVSKGKDNDEWNEVNVSFEGPASVVGIFSLDGIMSKIYATTLHLKSCRLLPVFAYNRGHNTLTEFVPTREVLSSLIAQVPVKDLQEQYSLLLDQLE